MIGFAPRAIRTILCLGAHCDDIEIGCGGALVKLLASNSGIGVRWVVFSSDLHRAKEARKSAGTFLAGIADVEVSVEAFRGRYFPYVGAEIKEYFDRLALETDPDLIFTHYRFDLHQDHRLLAELTYNTFRDHLVLEYEIPKYDGDMGQPNAYVHLEDEHCDMKIATILDSFRSQQDKHWFSEDVFRSLLRLRGIEARSPSGYAEGFYCRKLVLA
jgi:LmbE family N-acetylglucosaminyl deacetylase